MRSFGGMAGLVLVLVFSGCVSLPQDLTSIGGRYATVHFSGYASEPGIPIHLQVYNYGLGRFEPLGMTTASHVPLSLFGRTFYAWSFSTPIASESNPYQAGCRWVRYCGYNPNWADTAIVQAREGAINGFPMWTMGKESVPCMFRAMASAGGEPNPGLAYLGCHPPDPASVRLLP